MKFFFLLISAFLVTTVRAEDTWLDTLNPKDYISSFGAGLIMTSSTTDLESADDKKVMEFEPNVPSATGIFFETKYATLGYLFAGGDPGNKKAKKSRFQDFRFNFFWQSFDVRLNWQEYHGALVNEAGREEFYSDYELRSKNIRLHYYFTKDHLRFIREGKDLVTKAGMNEGFTFSSSLFWGINLDQRSLTLPGNLAPEHQARVNATGIDYDREFSAFSAGPLVGGDLMAFAGNFYSRGKLGIGPAFQSSGGSVLQAEVAFNVGYVIDKRHLISLGVDLYTIGFRDSDQRITNHNVQSNIGYTYSFVD